MFHEALRERRKWKILENDSSWGQMKTGIFSIKKKRKKKSSVTPTWLEHAAFWSGVRRATIAPRSPTRKERVKFIYLNSLKWLQYLYGLSIFHYQLTFDPVMGNLFSFVLTRNIRGKSVFCDYLKLLSTTTGCRWTRIEIWINFPFTNENKNVREMQRN